jgi:hypothetical protein
MDPIPAFHSPTFSKISALILRERAAAAEQSLKARATPLCILI